MNATSFQLIAAKGAVKLEALGMKHSSGRSARKCWALQLGLKANATHNAVIAALQQAIDSANA